MRLRTNKIMDPYLSQLGYDFMSKNTKLPKDLERIVNMEFSTKNDMILVTGLYRNAANPKYNTDKEKCEFKYNENHFHPDSFAKKDDYEIVYLKFAMECAKGFIQDYINNLKTRHSE